MTNTITTCAPDEEPGAGGATPYDIYCRLRSKFVKTDRFEAFNSALDYLMLSAGLTGCPTPGPISQAATIVLVGESGAGKSTTIDKAFRQREALAGFEDISSGSILRSMVASPNCTLGQLGRDTLHVLGFPIVSDIRAPIIWEMVRKRLKMLGIKILHIDEMQHVTSLANSKESVKILNTLKSLSQNKDWPVSLILSGLPELAGFIANDPQVRRRFRFVPFSPLRIPEDNSRIAMTVEAYLKDAGLATTAIDISQVVPRLIHAASYQFGWTHELLCDAVYEALLRLMEKSSSPKRSKKTGLASIVMEDFATAYAKRSGSVAKANPFLTADWISIDTTVVLNDGQVAPVEAAPVVLKKATRPKKDKATKREERGKW